MKKTYYFSHDMNARNDEKILNLRSEYGWEGYGVYFGLLEMMFEANDTQLKCANIKGIAHNFGIEKSRINEIIDLCIEEKLFETDGEYFWSNSLKKRKGIFENGIEQRREAGRKSAEKKKQKKQQELNDKSTTVERPLNDTATNKTKLNEIKLNKNNNTTLNYTTLLLLFNYINGFSENFDGITFEDWEIYNIQHHLKKLEEFSSVEASRIDIIPFDMKLRTFITYWVIKEILFSPYKIHIDKLNRDMFLQKYLQTEKYIPLDNVDENIETEDDTLVRFISYLIKCLREEFEKG